MDGRTSVDHAPPVIRRPAAAPGSATDEDLRFERARQLADLARTPARPAALAAFDEGLLERATDDLAVLVADGRTGTGLELATALATAWAALRYGEAERSLLRGLAAAAGGDTCDEGHALGEVLLATEQLEARWLGAIDPPGTAARVERGLRLVRGADRARLVRALDLASQTQILHGDLEHAGVLLRQGAVLTRGSHERLPFLGWSAALAHQRGDLSLAAAKVTEAHELAVELGDLAWVVRTALIMAPIDRRHLPAALVPLRPDEVLDLARLTGDRFLIGHCLVMTTLHATAGDGGPAAIRRCSDALRWSLDLGSPALAATALMVFVGLAARAGQSQAAARAHGAASVLLPAMLHGMAPSHHAAYRRVIDGVRADLGAAAYDRELEHGRAAPVDAAVLESIQVAGSLAERRPAAPPPRPSAGLTDREVQVLRILAVGASNREIGAELGLTTKTLMHHCTHIFTKLGVHGRGAAAAWAYEHGLVGAATEPA